MSNKKSVFLDANILYSWNLNHLLMFFCDTGVGLIEPFWSDSVVAEAVKNIMKNTGDDTSPRFEQMNKAYPSANVTGYGIVGYVHGVHPKDQEVAQAAIFNDCDFLVTNNLKHFKKVHALQTKPKVLTADSILTALAKKNPGEALRATVLAWWHRIEQVEFDVYISFISDNQNGLGLKNFSNEVLRYISELGQSPNDAAEFIKSKETRRF